MAVLSRAFTAAAILICADASAQAQITGFLAPGGHSWAGRIWPRPTRLPAAEVVN